MRNRRFALFALRVIEQRDFDPLDRGRIEAAHIDVDAIGIGARYVETLDAAMGAEAVLRTAGIERVFGQRIARR